MQTFPSLQSLSALHSSFAASVEKATCDKDIDAIMAIDCKSFLSISVSLHAVNDVNHHGLLARADHALREKRRQYELLSPIVLAAAACSHRVKGASMTFTPTVTSSARFGNPLLPVLVFLSLCLGCAGPQKAVDKKIITGTVGQKYSELMSRSGVKIRADFGPLLASESLKDGSTLHVHVQEYESGRSTTLGIWGDVEYSYRLFGFKVKDDLVQDWAYALFTPQEKASLLFGIEYGYDHDAMLARLKKDDGTLLKTSSDQPVATWKS